MAMSMTLARSVCAWSSRRSIDWLATSSDIAISMGRLPAVRFRRRVQRAHAGHGWRRADGRPKFEFGGQHRGRQTRRSQRRRDRRAAGLCRGGGTVRGSLIALRTADPLPPVALRLTTMAVPAAGSPMEAFRGEDTGSASHRGCTDFSQLRTNAGNSHPPIRTPIHKRARRAEVDRSRLVAGHHRRVEQVFGARNQRHAAAHRHLGDASIVVAAGNTLVCRSSSYWSPT